MEFKLVTYATISVIIDMAHNVILLTYATLSHIIEIHNATLLTYATI